MKDKTVTAEKRMSYTPLSVLALIFALAAGAVEAVLMLRYFEPYITVSTGEELLCFFSTDTVLPTVLYAVAAAAVAVLFIFGFIAQRRAPEPDERPSPLTGLSVFTGLVCGFALAAATVFFALGLHRSGTLLLFDKPVDVVTAALIICAIPAALYFIVVSFGGYKKPAVAVLGSFAVMWVALLLLRLYFTMDISLRSPTRILGQTAPIAIMLYLVQELRYRVGAKRAALFRVTAAVALIAIVLDAVMTAVLLLNWGISDTHLPLKTVELCIGVYIAVNMFYLPAGIKFSAALHIDEKKRALKELRRVREDREADAYLRDLMDDAADLGEGEYAAGGMSEAESARDVRENGYTGGYIDLGGAAFGDAVDPAADTSAQGEATVRNGSSYGAAYADGAEGGAADAYVGDTENGAADESGHGVSTHFDCPDEPELSRIPHWTGGAAVDTAAASDRTVPAIEKMSGVAGDAAADDADDTGADAESGISSDIEAAENAVTGTAAETDAEIGKENAGDAFALSPEEIIDRIIGTEITSPAEAENGARESDIAGESASEEDNVGEPARESDGAEKPSAESNVGERIASYQSALRRSLIDSIAESDMSGASGRDDVDAAGDTASDDAEAAPGAGNPPVTERADSAKSEPAQDSDDDDSLVRDFEFLRDDGSDDGFDSSSDMD